MATPFVRSCSPSGGDDARAPTRASELVRVSSPRRSLIAGSSPSAFISWSRCWVPQVPAATTTCWAVVVVVRLPSRVHAPVRSSVTSHVPSARSRRSLTVVRSRIRAPARSARAR